MSDILQIDFEEIEKVLPGSEDENSESLPSNTDVFKEDSKIGEEIKNESKQDNKSDIVILDSNATNNLRSTQTFNLSDFDSELLWENSNINTIFPSQDVLLSKDFTEFDYILINFRSNLTSSETGNVIIPTNSINERLNNKSAVGIGGRYFYGTNSYSAERAVYKTNDSTLYFEIPNITTGANYGIPINVYGLNAKTSVTPEPTPTPNPNPSITTSGNVINNYYNNYFGVSENALSWNLLNKPINQYTVSESLFLYQFLILFFVMMYLLIRRAVFKWK